MNSPSHRVKTRRPSGPIRMPSLVNDPDGLAPYLGDAAHTPGGNAPFVALPRNEGELVAVLREAPRILVVGAQSSLTGGATPMGEWVIATGRMNRLRFCGSSRVRVEAGVPLLSLQKELAAKGLFYPPATTFTGAFLGGTVATNAAGAATFKYGSTREWVRALRVILANGEVLEIHRGECRAHPEGFFEIHGRDTGPVRLVLPTYRMPATRKRSAGYHCEPGMDLIDLFIGSEGTLGIITEVELEVLPVGFQLLTGFLECPEESTALEVATLLRRESLKTRDSGDPAGLEVRSIEWLDARSLDLLRSSGEDRKSGLRLAADCQAALIFELEMPLETDTGVAREAIAGATDPSGPDSPLRRLCRFLERFDLLDHLQVALPGEEAKAEKIRGLREAVPVEVNHRIGEARDRCGGGVRKIAADMIVPFSSVAKILDVYREGFIRRGLDYAIWGHISDGNLHANAIPRSPEDVKLGREAILEFGKRVIDMGGCPLSEHGVGRDPTKQQLLKELYGETGIREMRAIKETLDPDYRLAPGVLFEPG